MGWPYHSFDCVLLYFMVLLSGLNTSMHSDSRCIQKKTIVILNTKRFSDNMQIKSMLCQSKVVCSVVIKVSKDSPISQQTWRA